MSFYVIAASDQKGGIGKDGKIPWYIPEDLEWFRKTTTNTTKVGVKNVVIMGRKTWESIPEIYRPLKDRLNIVITSEPEKHQVNKPDVFMVSSFEEALEDAQQLVDQGFAQFVFVIGGAFVYEQAFKHPACKQIILSAIKDSFDCDKFISIPLEFQPVFSYSMHSFVIMFLEREESND